MVQINKIIWNFNEQHPQVNGMWSRVKIFEFWIYDQEFMDLMQEHLHLASNVMEWSHVVAKFIDYLDEFDFTEEDKLLK